MPLDVFPVSQAFKDQSFDNVGACPDWANMRPRWIAASDRIRGQFPATMDLVYGPAERNRIDLFPGTDPDAPCLFFIHGGYWQRNSREMFALLGEGIRAHGWSVAMPSYTLAPEASLSQIVAEMGMALDWLDENGAQHGIGRKVIASGWSAGGHLAALASAHHLVAGGLCISGIYELGPIAQTNLNAKLCLTGDEIANLSPMRRPVIRTPLTIAYGANEIPQLVAQSVGFHALRQREAVPSSLLPVGSADHFTVLEALIDPDGALTRAALDLAKS